MYETYRLKGKCFVATREKKIDRTSFSKQVIQSEKQRNINLKTLVHRLSSIVWLALPAARGLVGTNVTILCFPSILLREILFGCMNYII